MYNSQVMRLATGFLYLVVSSLWEKPQKPRIEVTVATPDYDYLPDNHPLRKIHIHKPADDDPGNVTKFDGFCENVKKVLILVVQFHYQFYDDLFTVGKIGFGFLFYLVTSFPVDVFFYFSGNSSQSHSRDDKTLAENLKSAISLIPAAAFGMIAGVSSAVETVNQIVRNVAQNRQGGQMKKSSKSPSPSESSTKSTTPPTSKSVMNQSFTRKQSLSTTSTTSKKEESKTRNYASSVEKIPAKSIEAFKTEVKIQEEILKFGKEKTRDLFGDSASGPSRASGQ